MKEKLLRTKKELEKEYNLNSKEIRNIKEKIKILESNTLDHKFYTFAKSYAISLSVSMILLIIMGFNFPAILSSVIGTNTFNIIRYLFTYLFSSLQILIPIVLFLLSFFTFSSI